MLVYKNYNYFRLFRTPDLEGFFAQGLTRLSPFAGKSAVFIWFLPKVLRYIFSTGYQVDASDPYIQISFQLMVLKSYGLLLHRFIQISTEITRPLLRREPRPTTLWWLSNVV